MRASRTPAALRGIKRAALSERARRSSHAPCHPCTIAGDHTRRSTRSDRGADARPPEARRRGGRDRIPVARHLRAAHSCAPRRRRARRRALRARARLCGGRAELAQSARCPRRGRPDRPHAGPYRGRHLRGQARRGAVDALARVDLRKKEVLWRLLCDLEGMARGTRPCPSRALASALARAEVVRVDLIGVRGEGRTASVVDHDGGLFLRPLRGRITPRAP